MNTQTRLPSNPLLRDRITKEQLTGFIKIQNTNNVNFIKRECMIEIIYYIEVPMGYDKFV